MLGLIYLLPWVEAGGCIAGEGVVEKLEVYNKNSLIWKGNMFCRLNTDLCGILTLHKVALLNVCNLFHLLKKFS